MTEGSCKRLSEARVMAGLTTRQATELLGMQLSRLEALEQGTSLPSSSEIERLADVYGVTSDWLNGAQPAGPRVAAFRGAERLRSEDRDRITTILSSMTSTRREGR